MRKGLLFILVIAVSYWGYYFLKQKTQNRPPMNKSYKTVHSANLSILETSIEIFHQHETRYPVSLQELIDKGYLSRIPDSGGRDWDYDPLDGSVN